MIQSSSAIAALACLAASVFPLASIADNALGARYRAAVEDARKASPDEVHGDLNPVNAGNPRLEWDGAPGVSRVLIVTWTQAKFYASTGSYTIPKKLYMWVTPVPEVRDFCRSVGFTGQALSLRLEQVLGLPPGGNKDAFVEMWVRPADLFRPCPDPEITDRRCTLGFPRFGHHTSADAGYRQWFRENFARSYGEDGYPWTRLGYTYDWGAAGSEIGLSEYVLVPGAEVEVRDVSLTGAYCR